MSGKTDGLAAGGLPARSSAAAKHRAEQPPLPENWDRCHAYNKGKSRYCRQMPLPLPAGLCRDAPRYCGNHRHLLEEWMSKNTHNRGADGDGCHEAKRQRTDSQNDVRPSKRSQKDRGKRIPCPVDPTHWIFESSISKHVLICPAAKQKHELSEKDYYSEDINLGGFGSMGIDDSMSLVADLEDAKNLALNILRVFHRLFLIPGEDAFNVDGGTSQTESTRTPHSIQQLQIITEKEIYDALPEVDLSFVEEEGMVDAADDPSSTDTKHADDGNEKNTGKLTRAITNHKIKAGGPRHLRQIASILGHVRQRGLIPAAECKQGTEPQIIEVGAGRGMTGLVVAGAMAHTAGRVKLCLVERAGTRRKAETKARTAAGNGTYSTEDCLRLDLVEVTRVKCDLAHVDMSKALPPSTVSSSPAKRVVVAKHLCGAGTDLALKSLRNVGAIDGCVMATCCHGLCTWKEFVGRDCFLRLFSKEFGEKEFNLMKRWAPASVLDETSKYSGNGSEDAKEEHNDRDADDEKERYSNISAVVKELGLACGVRGLGRACQRLIDYGRCEYMRDVLFGSSPSGDGVAVRMLHYVPSDATPQNCLIVASRK